MSRSSIDTSSNTPFEALLCGTPVIVTDDCGCGEIIKEAGCGYLVRYGDVTDLGEALKFALENLDVNAKMVEAVYRGEPCVGEYCEAGGGDV